jgi:putative membrane protein
MFFKEVKSECFKKRHYILIALSMAIGLSLLFFGKGIFPRNDNPSIWQCLFIGLVLASSIVIPGVDNAVLLTFFGFYSALTLAIDNMNIPSLIPMALSVGVCGFGISFFMNKLLKKHRGATFSIIFGLFVSIIPSVLTQSETEIQLGFDGQSAILIGLAILGFAIAFMSERLKYKK